MAVVVKRHRVANPRKRRRRVVVARSKSGRFMKIRTKRRARVKARPVRRRRRVVTNRRRAAVNRRPRRRVVAVRRRRRTRRVSNPVLIELGAINPMRRRRTKKVAAKRRRVSRRRRVSNRRRRRNPVAVVRRRRRSRRSVAVAAPRRRRRHSNPGGRRRRVYHRRRRNPMGLSGSDMYKKLVGGIAGMALTKFLPSLIPASVLSSLGSSPIMSVFVTAAGAYASGMIAEKVAGPAWGQAVLVGGLIQTGSTALNVLAPSLASTLGVSGMGDIIGTQPFPVPNNQMRPMMVVASGGGVSGTGARMRRGMLR